MLRAAIIGLGRWGRSLVSSVQDNPDVRFVVGHTRTRSRAEEFCRDNGVRLVDNFDAVLSDSAVDAVVLATPHSQHAQQIKRAAEAGKHILVEKPITLDLASARSAVAAARQAGVMLAVGFCRRFHPSVGELRQRLCDGRLGKVVGMVAHHQYAELHPSGQLARRSRRGAGRRNDRGRPACPRSDDRIWRARI
jgi:predicted dehydrogenase